MMLTPRDHDLLRYSLAFVWLATACASLWERDGQSAQLLAEAGIHEPSMARFLIWSGAIIDGVFGLAIWFKPGRWVYLAALATMAGMTLAATVLHPAWWLHPFGSLTKNIPIAAALWILSRARA